MRRNRALARLGLLLTLFTGCAAKSMAPSVALTPPATTPLLAEHGVVKKGSILVVRLDQEIGTDLSHSGQPYSASLVEPVVDGRGRTVIPKGTQVTGRVEVLQKGSGIRPPRVELSVKTIRLRGVERPIRARVSAADLEEVGPGPSRERVRHAAVASAFVGAVYFFVPGAVLGYFAGQSGGSVAAAAGQVVNARLPIGSLIAIRVESPIG